MSIITSDDDRYQATMKRIAVAWKCISVPEYASKAQQSTIDNGEGINVFRFLKSRKNDEGTPLNCEYYYADKGCALWDAILDNMPDKHAFEKAYQKSGVYAICVSVPVDTNSEDTVQSVRIFHYDTNKEVFY